MPLSKPMIRQTLQICFLAALTVFATQTAMADRTVTVAVRDMVRAAVDVDIRCQGPCAAEPNISFVKEVAGIPVAKSGDRIVSVEAFGENGVPLEVKKFAPFEFVASGPYQRVVVKRTLERPDDLNQLAFRSWLKLDEGVLSLEDLIPEQLQKRLTVRFVLPQGIFALGSGKGRDGRTFQFDDAARGLVLIARDPVYGTSTFGTSSFQLASVGIWPIAPNEKMGMATGILRYYLEMFKSEPIGDPFIILVRPSAAEFPPNRWAAQVKGSTAIIVSTGVPFGGSQEGQRLHEQLRHEIFHMWAPNSVSLTGRYDWFYEGFAQYESLKMAVTANRIRFEDMLNTLARSYDVSAADNFPMSLIDASARRFQGNESRLYSRGLLVAFAIDVEMMSASDGRRGSADLLREIFQRHRRPAAEAEGNASVLEVMDVLPELRPIISSYIRGKERLKMEPYLEKAGLVRDAQSETTLFTASPKPTDLQKKVLEKLGYNTWRKFAP